MEFRKMLMITLHAEQKKYFQEISEHINKTVLNRGSSIA